MAIIGFIVIFTIIGFIIGVVIKDDNTAMGAIIVMSILWVIATFIELLLGYSLARKIL
jgi:hypothetical protein